jgi:hypothetical protein
MSWDPRWLGLPQFSTIDIKGQQTWPPFPSSYPVFSTALPKKIDNYLTKLQKITKIPYFHVFSEKKFLLVDVTPKNASTVGI